MFIGEYGTSTNLGEIPMPYKLECYNFNPHKILGSFDYEQKKNGKPIFYLTKYKVHTDKLDRPVNDYGFLIDEAENIINNDG
jgi:hypothetical protein